MSTLWQYEAPDGTVWPLTGERGVDELGVVGSLMPTYELLSQETYGGSAKLDRRGAGERTMLVRSRPRQLIVPLLVKDGAESEAGFDELLEELLEALNPEEGPGRLLATRVDDEHRPLLDSRGNVRTRGVRAYYVGGAEGTARGDDYGGWWAVMSLVFRAEDPYYRPLVPAFREYRTTAPVTWFPMLPLRLGAGSLLGESVEVNDGSVETYPVVRLYVPGTKLTATNRTTGRSWSVDTRPANGQTLTVDTRPTLQGGGRTVTREDGLSLYEYLAGDLWPLVRGRNDLTLSVEGETPGQTRLTVEYEPRHLAP